MTAFKVVREDGVTVGSGNTQGDFYSDIVTDLTPAAGTHTYTLYIFDDQNVYPSSAFAKMRALVAKR